jgi:hypothetical protein
LPIAGGAQLSGKTNDPGNRNGRRASYAATRGTTVNRGMRRVKWTPSPSNFEVVLLSAALFVVEGSD